MPGSEIPSGTISVGLHPCYITSKYQESLLHIQNLSKAEHVLAIGECGLDKICSIDPELQTKVFIAQIQLAEEIQKPLIIHCVKAFDQLIKILKEQNTTVPVIIHGFNNSSSIATSLLKQGFYLSFGKALLHSDSNASKAIRVSPPEKIFLETDDATISIKRIFEEAGTRLGMNSEELRLQIQSNFKKVFKHG
ncbi:MAG: TatD family hydrolase [Bacteroidota bacterium]|nr:TatD family hydrolase [Bacteroidota bacterium]